MLSIPEKYVNADDVTQYVNYAMSLEVDLDMKPNKRHMWGM